MKSIVFGLLVVSSLSAQASDHWDNCVGSESDLKIENGELYYDGQPDAKLGALVKEIKIKSITQTCKLAGTKQEVPSLLETTSYEVYKVTVNGYTRQADFLCTRGGSGIPAAGNCDESTVKTVEKYYVK